MVQNGKKVPRKRRSFTQEFKAEAVRLVLDEGQVPPVSGKLSPRIVTRLLPRLCPIVGSSRVRWLTWIGAAPC